MGGWTPSDDGRLQRVFSKPKLSLASHYPDFDAKLLPFLESLKESPDFDAKPLPFLERGPARPG